MHIEQSVTPIEKLINDRLDEMRKSLRWFSLVSRIDKRTIRKIMASNVISTFSLAQRLCWALEIDCDPVDLPLSKPICRPKYGHHDFYNIVARKGFERGESNCKIMRQIGMSQDEMRLVTLKGMGVYEESQRCLDLL